MLTQRQAGLLAIPLLLLLTAMPADAKQMYKYTDEQGIVHYSDKKPVTDQKVEARPMRMPAADVLSMRNIGTQAKPAYAIRNHLAGPVEVLLTLTESIYVRSEPQLPASVILAAGEERTVLRVFSSEPGKTGSFKWQYSAVPGDPAAQLDSAALNRIPFPRGEAYWVSQPFNGKQTHLDEQTKYAIDITMPEGTPVLATRAGVVMQMNDDFFEGGKQQLKYISKANIIRLLHDDGTMSVYAHLKLDSTKVRLGQRVAAGDRLAESGNTGFSSGPHLHFVIQKNAGGKLVSLPYSFTLTNGEQVVPDKQVRISP
ncbi:MAG: M23 family metallopeptidase [Xanthomonadales bacterium]|nr:M23 family metallopeptidase [Xanthomonadales bacterium]